MRSSIAPLKIKAAIGSAALRRTRSGSTATVAEMLSPTTTYYWRIDEKNGFGTTTGTVWSFTTAPTLYYPSSYTVNVGGYVSGTLPASVNAADSSYFVTQSQTSGTMRYSTATYTVANVSPPSATQMVVNVTLGSSSPSTNLKLYLYNNATSAFDLKLTTTVSTSQAAKTFTVTSGASNYVNSSTGNVQLKVEAYKTSTTFTLLDDVIQLVVTP